VPNNLFVRVNSQYVPYIWPSQVQTPSHTHTHSMNDSDVCKKLFAACRLSLPNLTCAFEFLFKKERIVGAPALVFIF